MENYFNPVKIYQGSDCISNLNTIISSQQLKENKILLIQWSDDALKSKAGEELLSQLKNYNVINITYNKSNPDIHDLYELYIQTNDENFEIIIAIGGGSVLDIGKSLACIYKNTINSVDELREKISNKEFKNPKCKWIGVPTTSGTGSEVTCWATVWDEENNSKLSLESQSNYALAAFADPRFTTTMPLHLVVSSALDAVAHATEAYWSKNTNLISRMYALHSIECILKELPNLINSPDNINIYDTMSKGSLLAGMAFSNTKTTACHSMSYPLTLQYKIPHGVAIGILLGRVFEANEHNIIEKEKLLNAYGVNSASEAKEKIDTILKQANIKFKLSEYGIKKEDLDNLSGQCFTKGRMENNPVNFTKNQVLQILKDIY